MNAEDDDATLDDSFMVEHSGDNELNSLIRSTNSLIGILLRMRRKRCRSQLPQIVEESINTLERESIHSIKPIWAIILLCFIVLILGALYYVDRMLPSPLKINDEENDPNAFIAERAQQDTAALVNLGPRQTGTYENEAAAISFIKKAIYAIKENAHVNQRIELDHQIASGSYYLPWEPYGTFNIYSNIQNIIVRLEGDSNKGLLVNAHFDTVAGSPGGSNDGIMVATMLEILRKFSQRPKRFEHTIIFLFNGAQETPLQGSHAFVTQHNWAQDVKIFVNLDSTGHGHKEYLLQTGPNYPWLVKYYKNVPHPYAQTLGEEIYESGRLGGGADFMIFRDFGKLSGYNLGFARGAYRYHNAHDDYGHIPPGSFQHVGDNVLKLLENLGNAPELKGIPPKICSKYIYYDFLGMFLIIYSDHMAFVINVVVSIFSLLLATKGFSDCGLDFSCQNILSVGIHFFDVYLGWTLGVLFIRFFTYGLDELNYSMTWYHNNWLVLGLFCVPTLLFSCGTTALIRKLCSKNQNICTGMLCQLQLHSVRLILSITLFIGTLATIRSVYVHLISVLFSTVAFGIIRLLGWQQSVRKWQIVYIISTIIPTIFMCYISIQLVAVAIPLTGQIGPEENPDLAIGCLCFGLTTLTFSPYVPLITLVSKPKIIFVTLFTIFITFLLIASTSLGFPYSCDENSLTPQRHVIFHTTRSFYDENGELIEKDSGYFMINMDRNSPRMVAEYVRDLKNIADVELHCRKYLLCGFPAEFIRSLKIPNCCSWIPTEQVIVHEPTVLQLTSKQEISPKILQYNFSLTGPNSMSFYFSPRKEMQLHSTSLGKNFDSGGITWKNRRPVYFGNCYWGIKPKSVEFSVNIKTPYENWPEKTLDFAVSATVLHERSISRTAQFSRFLSQFPEWATLTTGIASYESWVF